MEFFDTKEDVIDIQLTQFGKYLLSRGKFRPKYYSFSDDDILYDVAYASGSEGPYESHRRIKSETVRTKAQYLFAGAETEIRRSSAPALRNTLDNLQPALASSVDQRKGIGSLLGNTDPLSPAAPAYEIYFAKSPLSSSTMSDQSMDIRNVPQLEVDYILETKIGKLETNRLPPEIDAETATTLDLNDYFFYEEEEFVFLDVKEINQLFQRENFDIEVFEYITEQDTQGHDIERLRPLKFMPSNEDSLKYATGEQIANAYPALTEEYVEYYFNINVDEEIDEEILCQVHLENKVEDIFADSLMEFECVVVDDTGRRMAVSADLQPDGTRSTTVEDYDIEAPEDPC